MSQKTGVVFCNEQGILEQQSLLLVASMKKFLNQDKYWFFSCSPRRDFQPNKGVQNQLIEAGVTQVNEELNTDFNDYPIANKVLACRLIEKEYPELNGIIFVDSDTVFMNEMPMTSKQQVSKLFLRPVDNKGPGSTGKNDRNDEFWHQVFALFDLKDLPQFIKTTVGQHKIRGYYNAGFIWAHKLPGFFQQWYEDFITIVNSTLRPFGYLSRDGDDFRCLDQVALAVTASRYVNQLEILPETYNYPIPFKPSMQKRKNQPGLDQLVHIHYHKWFQHAEFLDHICSEAEKQSEQYRWLSSQLPLEPEISGDFKC